MSECTGPLGTGVRRVECGTIKKPSTVFLRSLSLSFVSPETLSFVDYPLINQHLLTLYESDRSLRVGHCGTRIPVPRYRPL